MTHAIPIDAIVSLLAETGTPGVSVAVNVDGEPVQSVGVGHIDPERTVPMPADARLPLYSITKALIATAALALAERGDLDLDRPLAPDLPDGITLPPFSLRQVLNHTAGLPDYGALRGYHDDVRDHPDAPWSEQRLLARTLADGAAYAPGTGWAYSNIGYLLAKREIQRITGQSLGDALQTLVFAPTGVTNLRVATTLGDMAALAPHHSTAIGEDGTLRNIAGRYHPGWVSHGLVTGDAAGTARVLDALFAGAIVAPASVAAMLDAVRVPYDHPLFAAPAYGLGLMIDLASPHGILAGHAGGGPGASTAVLHASGVGGRRVTVAALANRDAGDTGLRIALATIASLR